MKTEQQEEEAAPERMPIQVLPECIRPLANQTSALASASGII